MLTLYVVSALVGVGLALVAVVLGDHAHETDAHGDAGHSDGESHLWLPFLSLRFWTYGFAGFGLTGALVTILMSLPDNTVLCASLMMGLVCGTMVSFFMRLALRNQADSSTHVRDMLGLPANVLVAIRPNQPGKVRFSAKGEMIDMIAIADDNGTIEIGHDAIVVAVEGDRARVISKDSIFDSRS